MIMCYPKLKESIDVLRILIIFLVKYIISNNITISIGPQAATKWHNDIRKYIYM
jgi:hypothetical protein